MDLDKEVVLGFLSWLVLMIITIVVIKLLNYQCKADESMSPIVIDDMARECFQYGREMNKTTVFNLDTWMCEVYESPKLNRDWKEFW